MTEDDEEEFPGSIRPVSREEWLALTRKVSPMTEAEKERAAVVAWLLKETETLVWLGQVQAVRHYARRIESGEHLKEGR